MDKEIPRDLSYYVYLYLDQFRWLSWPGYQLVAFTVAGSVFSFFLNSSIVWSIYIYQGITAHKKESAC
jgi:hypothetical protein